jgi:hypothetical protein
LPASPLPSFAKNISPTVVALAIAGTIGGIVGRNSSVSQTPRCTLTMLLFRILLFRNFPGEEHPCATETIDPRKTDAKGISPEAALAANGP